MTATPDDLVIDPKMIEEQIQLEEEMRTAGINRYRNALKNNQESGRGSLSPPWQTFIKHMVIPVAGAIRATIEEEQRGRASTRRANADMLAEMDPMVLAAMTLRKMIDALALDSRPSLRRLFSSVGVDVETEHGFISFEKEFPGLFKVAAKRASATNNIKFIRRAMRQAFDRVGSQWEPWGQSKAYAAGAFLVGCVIDQRVLCETFMDNAPRRGKEHFARLLPEVEQWFIKFNAQAEILLPAWLPMIMPPIPWSQDCPGGYITGPAIVNYDLVSHRSYRRHGAQRYRELVNWDRAENAIDAINALQATKWAIRAPTLNVMEILHDSETDRAGMTSGRLEEPPKPIDIDTNAESRATWKHSMEKARRQQKIDIQKRMKFGRMLGVARQFSKRDALYYPQALDFRGRTYPRAITLSPHGDDFNKSLLTFGDGLQVTEDEHVAWLMIHGANVFGNDKVSHDDRIKWVEENSRDIHRCAEDPLKHRFWETADKPWQFLSFCFEFSKICSEGFGALTTLPCHIDGTCNGLQHLLAISRDAEGGRLVNLLPSDKPQDVYAKVAEDVMEVLRRRAGEPLAGALLEIGVTRKETKRGIMTIPYGATKRAVMNYAVEALIEKAKREPRVSQAIDDLGMWKLGKLLGNLTWEAIGQRIGGAMAVRAWLRDVAGIVTMEDGKALSWVPPHGITVNQPYEKFKEVRIRIRLGRRTLRIKTYNNQGDDRKVDVKRAKNGAPPNFIHALDASHQFTTIATAKAHGVKHFSTVHDSFGTHCVSMPILDAATKASFVAMYDGWCPMEALLDELEGTLSKEAFAKLPPVPPKGDLDISQIHQSDYFFS